MSPAGFFPGPERLACLSRKDAAGILLAKAANAERPSKLRHRGKRIPRRG